MGGFFLFFFFVFTAEATAGDASPFDYYRVREWDGYTTQIGIPQRLTLARSYPFTILV